MPYLKTILASLAVIIGGLGIHQIFGGSPQTTLVCEKPIPYSTYATPSGTFEEGYYVQLSDDMYAITEKSATSSDMNFKYITKAERDKLGYLPMPWATNYAETCVNPTDPNKAAQYPATQTDYDTYSKDTPPTKSEPTTKWQ